MSQGIDRRQLVTTAGGAALGTIAAASISGSSNAAATGFGTAFGAQHGVAPEAFKKVVSEASQDVAKQLWLEQRITPLAAPYRTSDDRLALPLAAPNRRLTERILKSLGIWDRALEAGMVDVSPYDPANMEYIGRNLADSMALNFAMRSSLADLLEAAFVKKTASEWERKLNGEGIPCLKVLSWDAWKKDTDARSAPIFARAKGHSHPKIGRAAWAASAQPYSDLKAREHVDSVSRPCSFLAVGNRSTGKATS